MVENNSALRDLIINNPRAKERIAMKKVEEAVKKIVYCREKKGKMTNEEEKGHTGYS